MSFWDKATERWEQIKKEWDKKLPPLPNPEFWVKATENWNKMVARQRARGI